MTKQKFAQVVWTVVFVINFFFLINEGPCCEHLNNIISVKEYYKIFHDQ